MHKIAGTIAAGDDIARHNGQMIPHPQKRQDHVRWKFIRLNAVGNPQLLQQLVCRFTNAGAGLM